MHLKRCVIILAFCSSICLAQSTTVTGPVVDPSGNIWSNATIRAVFTPAPNVPGPYVWSGGVFNQNPAVLITDSSGNFTITLPSNLAIQPGGSSWQFITGPNTTTSAAIANLSLNGGTVNLASVYTATNSWPVTRINPTPIATVYSVNQTLPPPTGQGGLVFNTTSQAMEVYTNIGWQAIGSGGGGGSLPSPAIANGIVFVNPSGTNTTTDSTFNYNSTTHTLNVQTFSGTATNYPRIVPGQARAGFNFNCIESLVPDATAVFDGSSCTNNVYTSYYPGWNYGNGVITSNQGWYGSYAFVNNITDYSAGISAGLNVIGTWHKPGDIAMFNPQGFYKPAFIAASDEGVTNWRSVMTEDAPYLGNVVTGGTGATAITLTASANRNGIGLNSPLLDLTSVQTGNVTATAFIGGSRLQSVTVTQTVGVSTVGTLAANVDVPILIPNNTKQLSHLSVTINYNLPSPITVGEVCSVMGPNSLETITPTAVGTYSGGVQSVTALYYYSHSSGTQVYCGGAAGMYLEDTAYTIGINRYVQNVFGSTGVHTLVVGFNDGADIQSYPPTIGPMNLYKGAEVIGVINPSTGIPDGNYLAVEANNAAWATSDAVENVNNIAALYIERTFSTGPSVINNPYAFREDSRTYWNGLGGGIGAGAAASAHDYFINNNAISSFVGAGGIYSPPTYAQIYGATRGGFVFQYHPLYVPNDNDGVANCGGYLLCTGGLAPGATSSIEGIYYEASTVNAWLRYNHATGNFEIGPNASVSLNGDVSVVSIKPHVYTVSSLPSAATIGAGGQVQVSDATTFTPGTCTGGGSDYMIAISNGTTWSCH